MDEPTSKQATRTIKVPVTLCVGPVDKPEYVPPMTAVAIEATEAAALVKRFGGQFVKA